MAVRTSHPLLQVGVLCATGVVVALALVIGAVVLAIAVLVAAVFAASVALRLWAAGLLPRRGSRHGGESPREPDVIDVDHQVGSRRRRRR